MNYPKVSVLIPLYNSENYIADTIESCLNQTYANIEVIIIDDESTDNSLQIAKQFESDKVKVYSQVKAGAPRARNTAFELSTGDYIQYLDADDVLAANKIEEQVILLEKSDNNVVSFCPHTRDYQDFIKERSLKFSINKSYEAPLDLLLDIFNGNGNIITLCWLVPRHLIELVDKWDEQLIKAQDGEFFVRVLLNANAVKCCNKTLVYYRPHPGTITTNSNTEAIKSVIRSNKSIQKSILDFENSKRTREALVRVISGHFCAYYSKKNKRILKPFEEAIIELGGRLMFKGNKYLKILSYFIGVKNVLILRKFLK